MDNDVASYVVGLTPLRISEVTAIARGARIQIAAEALDRVERGRVLIDELADDPAPHYGVSTGFGALATTFISRERRSQLQQSLVCSHAAGTGDEVSKDVVRALMVLRLQTLLSGRTGVSREICELYAAMLNQQITPVVHEYGSLGCSGDLAPLAHVALVAIGSGQARDRNGIRQPGIDALSQEGLTPVSLKEKEGLALINGTDGMLGMLALAIEEISYLLDLADLAVAMSVEALMGTNKVFAPELHELRPHPGQVHSARAIYDYLSDSPIVQSHAGPEDGRVQDAYSLRCAPQVHGAARDTLSHAHRVATVELGSVIDNPVITSLGTLESNGNFHGAPLGYVLDFLAIAVADVASMSERRTDRFLDVSRNHGLPPFLAHEVGVDSGLMIAQYTSAAIVSELKRLAQPASVDSIPSSAMQEDHVSMGWHAGHKLLRSVDGLRRVLAIEIMTASRALALRTPLQPGSATGAVKEAVEEAIGGPGPDRFLSPDIEAVVSLVREGTLLSRAKNSKNKGEQK